MSATLNRSELRSSAGLSGVITLAVQAVGGQGGGVLANWIADLASLGGWDAQVTSVAGVAQRTGSTIYYIEMAPRTGRQPIFAQSPSPGDVDVLIASELMEAGRAVMRGFVTPDRTTLIASTHRILAVSEKQMPGDGRSDAALVQQEIKDAALNCVCFDMERIAVEAGSVISSSLFGALARAGVLPFAVEHYESVIRESGRGVEQSLSAFRATLNYVDRDNVAVSAFGCGGTIGSDNTGSTVGADITGTDKHEHSLQVVGPQALVDRWNTLVKRLDDVPSGANSMAAAGLRKVVDFQDVAYGSEYLDRLALWQALDDEAHGYELTRTAAKYVANAMCYDDILRVADLKIRASRSHRVRREQSVDETAIVQVTEYFHPRAEEITTTLPATLGAWLQDSPKLFSLFDRVVNRGRRLRTDRLGGFLTLRCIAAIKPYRRKLLRHRQEMQHLEKLTAAASVAVAEDYALAVEILKCQRLIKGYSDTHMRGHSKYDRLLQAATQLQGKADAASSLRAFREAALRDEEGTELDIALKADSSGG